MEKYTIYRYSLLRDLLFNGSAIFHKIIESNDDSAIAQLDISFSYLFTGFALLKKSQVSVKILNFQKNAICDFN